MWMVVNCRNGVSSYEIHRAAKVTQKTAWFMDHRVRLALGMESSREQLSGEIEVDETFIGGKARNRHTSARKQRITGTGPKDKAAVMGVLKRGAYVDGKVHTNGAREFLAEVDNGWDIVEYNYGTQNS
jgi:hypothetical protein